MNIELEITLRCNRACPHCNRYCNLFDWMPLNDTDMTLEQIDRFCSQVERKRQKLGLICIIGGEPLLHPQIEEIISMLHQRLQRRPRLVRSIEMLTNGDRLRKIHPRILQHIKTRVCWEKGDFSNVLVAPRDTNQAKRHCPVASHCGIALNCWGYWPCGPACAIARLFGLRHLQRLELPDSIADFGDTDALGNIPEVCNLCQWSAKHPTLAKDVSEPTSSYLEAMAKYQAAPVCPTLPRF